MYKTTATCLYFDKLQFGFFDAMAFSTFSLGTACCQISTCPLIPRCKSDF